MKTILIPALVLWGQVLFLNAQTESCLECHDDSSMTMERDGEEVSIAVAAADFAGTPHEGFDCVDCHGDLDENEFPHADPMPLAVAGCLDCHDGLAESHPFHPDFGEPDAETVARPGVNCTDCHGAHTIRYKDDPQYPFTATRQTSKCGVCHELESVGYLHSAHARALEEGAEAAPTCLSCHESEEVTETNGHGTAERKIRLAELCMGCHIDNPEVAGQTIYGTPFMTSFADSVHGKALFSGNPDAPSCDDCHGSHEVARAADQYSHVSRGHVVSSCSQCHPQAAEDYLHSIHARSFSKGNLDAPVCTDCHGEHNILAPTDPDSPVAAANLAEQVCGDCHGSVKLAERYGMDPNRVDTFEDSFHGLATRGGAVEAINCASCHAYHDVRTMDDPESWVHPDNLAKTCGNCHEGANERFAKGKVHVSIDRASEEPILFWIATIYTWGIVLIVGGMFLHNFLDFFHKTREKAKAHWFHHHLPADQSTPHRLYLRMTLNERLQHGILALSFIVLVITGFMLRYPDAWWVVGLRNLSSHIFEWRGLTHRVAGVVMCLAGVWHFYYVTFTKRGRELIRDLFPCVKDLKDMIGVLKYNIGMAKKKPLFDRFSYIEKAEYWALIWGSILMTVTGFLLWFENETIGLFTKLGFDISRTIHFYEAILATLAIIVWHFYFVIFNPDVYPMNLSWLTGRMSEEEMETEHPLELERIKRGGERGTRD
ncbi:MAG: cytochrome c3 family protein [Oceanipulchritudo sp.]